MCYTITLFLKKCKGFYKTFIIKVIFLTFNNIFHLPISITASTSISGKYVSNISSQLLLSSPSRSPHTGKIQAHVLFPLHKKRTIFPTSARKNLRKPDACPGEKVSPSSQFPSAVSAVHITGTISLFDHQLRRKLTGRHICTVYIVWSLPVLTAFH